MRWREAEGLARRRSVLRVPSGTRESLVDRTGAGPDTRIELDLAKGIFVVHQVLLQDGVQRLGLLRTQVHALKIAHVHASFVLLLQRPEHQKKVPDVDPHLHAIGVVLAVVGSVRQLKCRLRDGGLGRIGHGESVSKAAVSNRQLALGIWQSAIGTWLLALALAWLWLLAFLLLSCLVLVLTITHRF